MLDCFLCFVFLFLNNKGVVSIFSQEQAVLLPVLLFSLKKTETFRYTHKHVALAVVSLPLSLMCWSQRPVVYPCFVFMRAWVWSSCSEVISSPLPHTALAHLLVVLPVGGTDLFRLRLSFCLEDKICLNVRRRTGFGFVWFCPLIISDCSHFMMMPLRLIQQQNDLYFCVWELPAVSSTLCDSLPELIVLHHLERKDWLKNNNQDVHFHQPPEPLELVLVSH